MKNWNPGKRLLLLLAPLAICAAAVAGCGGGGTTTVTVTGAATTSPPSETSTDAPSTEEADQTVVEGTGAVAGYVDNVASKSGTVILSGWAAAPDFSAPADQVTATVGKKKVAEATPKIEREDVVEALGKPGLKDSGFELHLPIEELECGSKAAGIEVTAVYNGKSGPIEFGEGVEPKLTEAC